MKDDCELHRSMSLGQRAMSIQFVVFAHLGRKAELKQSRLQQQYDIN